MPDYRIESDSLGNVNVPSDMLYGAQTQRARDNFPVSSMRIPRRMIRALGLLKKAAAQVNLEKGNLTDSVANAVIQAAGEVADGDHDREFVVDIFQTGSGTSSNMNTNEVIANRAIQILGGEVGSKKPVHPNDHVNRGQSSNDIIPTAIHIAVLDAIQKDLLPNLRVLADALEAKAVEFDGIVKVGRTHLQDAVPIRLGQEFSGFAAQARKAVGRIEATMPNLSELPLKQNPNLFEGLASRDALVEASGALRTVAVSLMKIAEDIRWLGSGPRCGIAELILPDLQPGSSIMPGKVNPVMSEMMLQVGAQVQGNDLTVSIGGQGGHFELNTMMPVMAYNILQSIQILGNAAGVFADKCVKGLKANEARCKELVEKSLALVTALAPAIGYDQAAAISKEAFKTGRTIRDLCLEKNILAEAELDKLLDAKKMTGK
ncbi:MAG: class II fumarate hydratase [Acidobacteriota bacterium]